MLEHCRVFLPKAARRRHDGRPQRSILWQAGAAPRPPRATRDLRGGGSHTAEGTRRHPRTRQSPGTRLRIGRKAAHAYLSAASLAETPRQRRRQPTAKDRAAPLSGTAWLAARPREKTQTLKTSCRLEAGMVTEEARYNNHVDSRPRLNFIRNDIYIYICPLFFS